MKNIAAILLMAVALLLMLGALMLFSGTVRQPSLHWLDQHLTSMALGLFGLMAAAIMDYRWLRRRRLPQWLFGLSVALLFVALLPGIGTMRNGASRWLFGVQPSEMAKLALIIFLADYTVKYQDRMEEPRIGFTRPGLIVMPLLALIFLEPDWGSAFLMAAVAFVMLLVAGANLWRLMGAGVAGSGLFALLLWSNPLRLTRVLAFLDPAKYKSGVGWQAWIAERAMAHGGIFGTQLANGSYKNGMVPEQLTDFVLSLIGEELGLLGTWLVLALFVVIILCGSRIAWRVADPFGRLLGFGVTILIGLQALFNVCVATSCLPNKGIALPFVSYGGSDMVVMLTGVGLLLNLAWRGPFAPLPPLCQAEFDFPITQEVHAQRSFQLPPRKRAARRSQWRASRRDGDAGSRQITFDDTIWAR